MCPGTSENRSLVTRNPEHQMPKANPACSKHASSTKNQAQTQKHKFQFQGPCQKQSEMQKLNERHNKLENCLKDICQPTKAHLTVSSVLESVLRREPVLFSRSTV